MHDRSLPPVLLYDGTCGFCARSVQFVLDHERDRHSLTFARLAGALGDDLRRRHPALASVDSVIWFEPADDAGGGTAFVRSAAVLRVLRYLGGGWRVLGLLGTIVPRSLRDWLYDVVARRRRTLVRRSPSCLVPSAEQRKRFLDAD
jgi:predicted DCC family thiol-disulfide oxidoreductase YuxK